MTKDARRLMVRSESANAVDRKKLDWVIENDHPDGRYDLARFSASGRQAGAQNPHDRHVQKSGMGRGKWIHHPEESKETKIPTERNSISGI